MTKLACAIKWAITQTLESVEWTKLTILQQQCKIHSNNSDQDSDQTGILFCF